MRTSESEFRYRLARDLKEKGLGPLAAFLVRANWPLATIYANILMGAEPFLAAAGFEARPFYETLNDREALNELLQDLEEEA